MHTKKVFSNTKFLSISNYVLNLEGESEQQPVILLHARLRGGLQGGKGGFGAMLRIQAKQKGAKKTTDFGACRDLSGRRLRHVNDEIILNKWKTAHEKGETLDTEQVLLSLYVFISFMLPISLHSINLLP